MRASLAPNQDLALFNVCAEAHRPIKVEVRIGDSPLIMEVDTGAAVHYITTGVQIQVFSIQTTQV